MSWVCRWISWGYAWRYARNGRYARSQWDSQWSRSPGGHAGEYLIKIEAKCSEWGRNSFCELREDVTFWRAVGSACLFLLWNCLSVHVWHQTVWNLLAICQIDRNLIKGVTLCPLLPPPSTCIQETKLYAVKSLSFWVSWTVTLYTGYFTCSFLNAYTSWWDNYA